VTEGLQSLNLSLTARAEVLSAAQFIELSRLAQQ